MKVFFSYAAQDRRFAERLVDLLKSSLPGVQVILPEDLAIGKSLTEELRHLLVSSDAVIFLFSPYSSKNAWILSELGAALALQKPILPVVIGVPQASLPSALRSIHYLTLDQIEKDPKNLARFLAAGKDSAAASN